MSKSNPLIESVLDPIEAQKIKVLKERGDVTRSINSIEGILKGIIDKEQKLEKATTKVLKKSYKSQLKDSNKYLNKLFKTFKLEITEAIKAEVILKEMGPKDNA